MKKKKQHSRNLTPKTDAAEETDKVLRLKDEPDEGFVSQLIRQYRPYILHRFRLLGYEPDSFRTADDLDQSAAISVLKLIAKFNSSGHYSTYGTFRFFTQVSLSNRRVWVLPEDADPWKTTNFEPEFPCEKIVDRHVKTDRLNEITIVFERYQKQDRRRAEIVWKRVNCGCTLQDVGEKMKLTRERVRQLELSGMRNLRTMFIEHEEHSRDRAFIERHLAIEEALSQRHAERLRSSYSRIAGPSNPVKGVS